MAPQVFEDPFVSRTVKYDVYGFGIFLWELLTEKKPFEHGKCPSVTFAKIMTFFSVVNMFLFFRFSVLTFKCVYGTAAAVLLASV